MAVSSPEEVAHWEQMGFEVPAPEGRESGYVHLNNAVGHPRVVPVEHPRRIAEPHEEDRFKVLLDEDDDENDEDDEDDVKPLSDPVIFPPPTPEASPGRTQGAAARRATASRRPARRRR